MLELFDIYTYIFYTVPIQRQIAFASNSLKYTFNNYDNRPKLYLGIQYSQLLI